MSFGVPNIIIIIFFAASKKVHPWEFHFHFDEIVVLFKSKVQLLCVFHFWVYWIIILYKKLVFNTHWRRNQRWPLWMSLAPLHQVENTPRGWLRSIHPTLGNSCPSSSFLSINCVIFFSCNLIDFVNHRISNWLTKGGIVWECENWINWKSLIKSPYCANEYELSKIPSNGPFKRIDLSEWWCDLFQDWFILDAWRCELSIDRGLIAEHVVRVL